MRRSWASCSRQLLSLITLQRGIRPTSLCVGWHHLAAGGAGACCHHASSDATRIAEPTVLPRTMPARCLSVSCPPFSQLAPFAMPAHRSACRLCASMSLPSRSRSTPRSLATCLSFSCSRRLSRWRACRERNVPHVGACHVRSGAGARPTLQEVDNALVHAHVSVCLQHSARRQSIPPGSR